MKPESAAVWAALHLRHPQYEALKQLSDAAWREALAFCDRARLTLALRDRARGSMPPWVQERVAGDAARNRDRLDRLRAAYTEIAKALDGIDFVLLKGPAQTALSGESPASRVQYDIDLYLPRENVTTARDRLFSLGYESFAALKDFPTDHLPPLIRKTGWEWRGDYFDPEIPSAVELHFRFWDEPTERLGAPGVEEFWERQVTAQVAGLELPVLNAVDALGYTALHALRHLLRGEVSPFSIYELALILERHAGDEAFWNVWRRLHSTELQRLEAVSFQLAKSWFGCETGPVAEEAIARLPEAALAWFDRLSAPPLANKQELWLHLSLLHSAQDCRSVARRRLLPLRMPGPIDAVYLPESQITWRRRWKTRMRYGAYVAGRVRHHLAALPPVAATGIRWWFSLKSPGSEFLTFLGAASLYNLALFIFVLLYNLRLLELGFREDFLGVVSGAGTVGAVAGTIPAAFLARRFGLRNTLLGSFVFTAAITALRAVAVSRVPLVVLAFCSGISMAIWAVVFAPLIAQLVAEKWRPAAFSIFFALMIGLGIAGGWLGGRLPLWVHGKEPALLIAAAIVALSIWPTARLPQSAPVPRDTRIYPRSSVFLRFLVPFALFNLATGSFNPFFNAYFARLSFSVERIGLVFSLSQLAQVATVLLVPLVLTRAGLVGGIVWTMLATALGLAGLALRPAGALAAAAYIGYMAFQWMSEPGMNTLMMNQVGERERSGAAALAYLVAFSAQALAAFGAGALLPRAGYGLVIGGAAVLALMAAGLLRVWLAPARRSAQSQQAPAAANVPG